MEYIIVVNYVVISPVVVAFKGKLINECININLKNFYRVIKLNVTPSLILNYKIYFGYVFGQCSSQAGFVITVYVQLIISYNYISK